MDHDAKGELGHMLMMQQLKMIARKIRLCEREGVFEEEIIVVKNTNFY